MQPFAPRATLASQQKAIMCSIYQLVVLPHPLHPLQKRPVVITPKYAVNFLPSTDGKERLCLHKTFFLPPSFLHDSFRDAAFLCR